MGCENEEGNNSEDIGINPGLGLGTTPGSPFYKEVLDIYESWHMFTWDGKMMDTVVKIVSDFF